MLIVFYIMMITQDETIKLEKLFSIVVKQEEAEAAEGVGGRMERQLFEQRSRDNDLPHAVDTI